MDAEQIKQTTFAITTPLYYVNDLPHIGSAYPTIAADAVARFQRLRGHSVLFITGTDEHGQKIQRTAEALGRTPAEHCEPIVAGFQQLWRRLNIQYDRFIRTTDERHGAIVQEFFQRVWDQGDIYLSQQQGWYCVSCEEFKDERELLEDHRCPIHPSKAVEWRDEENYFFRLSGYQEKLEKLYHHQPDFIQPDIRRNEVLSFVQQGLRDFSISRVNVSLGFPVPQDANHTIYVWFDALLGYMTALLDPDHPPTLDNALKQWWPVQVHLIGKDILRFHAVYWPAMLMSAGLPLPDRVFGHGFLVRDGLKMGKSSGNVIDPMALLARYPIEAIRYYLLKEIEFGRDGTFDEVRFVNICNADLANDLGNLLNRTAKMVHKYREGVIPALTGDAIAQTHALKAIGVGLADRVSEAYDALAFSSACQEILALVRMGNKYLDEQAPWSQYKQGNQMAVDEILYTVLESVRLAAYLLSPIVPELSTAIYQQLGYAIDFDSLNLGMGSAADEGSLTFQSQSTWGILPAKEGLPNPQPVFQKLTLPDEPAP